MTDSSIVSTPVPREPYLKLFWRFLRFGFLA
jgi:hypothetical protein